MYLIDFICSLIDKMNNIVLLNLNYEAISFLPLNYVTKNRLSVIFYRLNE